MRQLSHCPWDKTLELVGLYSSQILSNSSRYSFTYSASSTTSTFSRLLWMACVVQLRDPVMSILRSTMANLWCMYPWPWSWRTGIPTTTQPRPQRDSNPLPQPQPRPPRSAVPPSTTRPHRRAGGGRSATPAAPCTARR